MVSLSNAERQQRLRDRRTLQRAKDQLSMPNASALRQHVEELCSKTGIARQGHIFASAGRDRALAYGTHLVIQFPTVRGPASYATALHEIGHCLGRHQDKSEIQRGAAAWLWARRHALIWTPAMAKCALRALRSYAAAWQPQTVRTAAPGSSLGLTPGDIRRRRATARAL
jgi:hypothetical protein